MLLRMLITVVLAITVSISITAGNYIIPIPVTLACALLLFITKRKVKDVLEDERDFELGGHAARYAITTYTVFALIVIFILLNFRQNNPNFDAVASALAYSACFLLILYSIIFKYLAVKDDSSRRKFVMAGVIALVLALLAIVALRLFSGEDDWICQNGNWVKHGQPNFPAPKTLCR